MTKQICLNCGGILDYYPDCYRCPVCDIPMRPFDEPNHPLTDLICKTCGLSFVDMEDILGHYCDKGIWKKEEEE